MKKDIIKAYCRIREIDNTIPDDVLDFMKNSALDAIERRERLGNPNCIQEYITTACEHFNLPKEKVISKNRKRELVTARHLIAVMLLNKGFSLKTVAQHLGSRHHSTIISARRTVSNLSFSDPDYNSRKRQFLNFINNYNN
jgi:chromosomal replication initiation ATPase DnaA